jgi:hypothetical protein
MRRVLVTGMSGTGKSTALAELDRRGFRTVDSDRCGLTEWVPDADGGGWLWREQPVAELLEASEPGRTLYVSACVANQGLFYDRFDAVVLLSAPTTVILDRIAGRTTNDYGKRPGERELILDQIVSVEPLLRATCTHEVDGSRPLAEVVEALIRIGRDG